MYRDLLKSFRISKWYGVLEVKETLTYAVYFSVYESLTYGPFVKGSIAGAIAFTLTYPLDTIKVQL